MFIDRAKISVCSGSGGDGVVSFRREKYVPRGGPDGGDGGRGGSVSLAGTYGLNTLIGFRYRPRYIAHDGKLGAKQRRTGASGENLVILCPVGTQAYRLPENILVADLDEDGKRVLIARGGRGGKGNVHFATSTRQAPRISTPGGVGEAFELQLELKLIADVGLAGMPNAGKSSILARLTNARPEIAAYPFTTLEPQLGVVRLDTEREFVVADLPGLIEGAHRGVGLGDRFLRHVRRARLLLHLVDAAAVEGRAPLKDYQAINAELQAYDPQVAALPQMVVLTKLDLPAARENLPRLQEELARRGEPGLAISAATGEGLPELLNATFRRLQQARPAALTEAPDLYEELPLPPERPLEVQRLAEGAWEASGTEVERIMLQSDFSTRDASRYFHHRLGRAGLFRALSQAGLRDGATVRIAEQE
ncbi:MAG: GTPase ObgE, partial [bacterium]|nr:GTPase ObgE [bacterium]